MHYGHLKIEDFTYWTLLLNENQCYLGRCCLLAKRPDAKDFLEMTLEERQEFFDVAILIKISLEELFAPDLFNYASLGNVFNHLHVHIIPRYKEKRTFLGYTFIDERWGKNYSPYDKNFKIPIPLLLEIKNSIHTTLNKR